MDLSGSGCKYLQKYPINARVPQVSSLGSTVFQPRISDIHDDIICTGFIYADFTDVIGLLVVGSS